LLGWVGFQTFSIELKFHTYHWLPILTTNPIGSYMMDPTLDRAIRLPFSILPSAAEKHVTF
jgi:hypothetical protein